jgi:hypothetical protein
MTTPTFRLYEDGAYDICVGGTVLLMDCFPLINGRPLRAKSVSLGKDEIAYQTREGTIHLSFTQDKDSAAIIVKFEHYQKKIHDISPLGNGEVCGLEGFYQAARSIGAPCGWVPETTLREKESAESSGLLVLGCAEDWLTIYGDSFYRYDLNGVITAYKKEPVLVSLRYSLENLNQADEVLSPLRLILSKTMEEGLHHAASSTAKNMKARQDKPPAFHWCSWYYCYHNFDQPQLEEYLQGMKDTNMLGKIRYIQIDAGYFPSAGDWLIPNERWPKGIKGAFETIKKAGGHPGIWIGPYMVGNRSVLYREHPDWMIYKNDGKPLCAWEWYNEPKVWGFQDEEYYVLDTSHPEAMAYIRKVFRTFREWGAEIFKTDFMLWGYVDSSLIKRHTPGKTSIEYFRDFLKAVREEIGEESYWLGCIAPFLPFIGYADGMRIGGDVGSKWKGEFSPQNMIQSIIGNNYTNYLYYQNDPDSLLLRDFFIDLNDTEVESLTLLAVLSGGCLYTSDPIHKLRKDRLELLRFSEPKDKYRPVLPYLGTTRDDIVLVHKGADSKRGIVFVFNRSDAPITAVYSLVKLGFSNPMKVYDYHKRDIDGELKNQIIVDTPAHGCNLFFLNEKEETPDYSRIWNNI